MKDKIIKILRGHEMASLYAVSKDDYEEVADEILELIKQEKQDAIKTINR
jgi:hypothetical protein